MDREGDFIFATATVTDARGRRLAIGHHAMLLLGPGRHQLKGLDGDWQLFALAE